MQAVRINRFSSVNRWFGILAITALVTESFGVNAAAATNGLWQKMVMIGASASAGFTVSEPFGGTNTLQVRLSRYVDAAVTAPHEPVLNLANSLFFLQPESAGKAQMVRALKEQPSVLLGVDFLFWFCYGRGTNDAERLLRFDYGLQLLEPATCPLILGDLPDASATVGIMLRPDQMPSTNALSAANARLRTWAATRTNVLIVPLAKFTRNAMHNGPLVVHGMHLPAGQTRALLQDDKLHPSPAGTAAIALAALTELQLQCKFPDTDVRWDLAGLVRAVQATLRANQNTSPPPARSSSAGSR